MLFSMLRIIAFTHRRCLFAGCHGSAQSYGSLRTSVNWRFAQLHDACAALIFGTALLTSPVLLRAAADDLTAGRAELQKTITSPRPSPSVETYPVEFSVGGINFRIPRNYLTTMGNWSGGPQNLVTLAVNIHDLRPLSQDTVTCFAAKPPDRSGTCEPFSFTIKVATGPSAEAAFERSRHLFRSALPIDEPTGFEKYEVGQEDSRLEYYRKSGNDRTLLYVCFVSENQSNRNGLCTPIGDRLTAGPSIQFFFDLKKIEDIAQIDAKLRKLVDGFIVGDPPKKNVQGSE
jgi:hypothetical protein